MAGWSVVCLATIMAVAVVAQPQRDARQSPFRPPRIPQGFTQTDEDIPSDDTIHHNTLPTIVPNRHQQALQYRPQEASGYRSRPQEYSGQQIRKPINKKGNLKEEDLEEEEKEEPDRLTVLLPQSKFNCDGKKTGYYADEGLSCEVFHYCQDNARHSWICPEGFLFHQVHLICMPPSSDNICSQSSQFHFVNEYLYKPINAEEVGRKPNVTLRYSERYYPENFYTDDGYVEEQPVLVSTPAPIQIEQQRGVTPRPHHQVFRLQQQHQQQQQPRPHISNQVFHSPEEVNIPLHHRRPGPQPLRHPTAFHHHPHSAEDFDY